MINRIFMLANEVFYKIINSATQYDCIKIINKIKKYKYISFDIFDTLVKRSVVNPTDVYATVARDYNDKFDRELAINKFQKDRIEAEKSARKKYINENNQEVTLEDIYNSISDEYSLFDRKILRSLEEKREVMCCHENYTIKKVFEWCKKNKKIIILVSDMYLPNDVVESILKKCKYIGYDKLYVSSDLKKNKSSGLLFKKVLNDYKISGESCIHIGDDIRADFIGAIKAGLHTCLIARINVKSTFCKKYKIKNINVYSEFKKLINSGLNEDWNIYTKFGYEVIGPIVYNFCVKLHMTAIKNNEKQLFFMSRDGYMLMQAYNHIYKNNSIKNKYVYMSRTVLSIANLHFDSSLNNLINLQGNGKNKKWTYKEICSRCGIDEKLGLKVWENVGLNKNDYFRGKKLINDVRIIEFYKNLELKIKNKAKEQFSLIKKYFLQEEFVGKIGIVDSGGYGTCQNMLEKIGDFTKSFTIYGYYIWNYKREFEKNRFCSFPLGYMENIIFTTFLEAILTSNEGTVLGFTQSKDKLITPYLDKCEYKKNTLKMLADTRKGIYKFINDVISGYKDFVFDDDIVISNYLSFVLKPTKEGLNMLKDFNVVNDNEKTYVVTPYSFVYYMKNIKKFFYDYSISNWKEGFLKQVFKIPFPYHQLIVCLRSFRIK